MVPLPFPASFLPSMGDRACRYSQGGLLRYDCRGLASISSHSHSKLRASRRRVARSSYRNLISACVRGKDLHG